MSLHDCAHIDTKSDVVVLDALFERRILDDIIVEVVSLHIAGNLAKSLERAFCNHDSANRERRKPVEVHDGILASVVPLVAFRPLADVAIKPDGSEVAARHEVHIVAVSNEVGEGQFACVGMVHELSEADTEGANLCRHQDVTSAGSLRAPFQHAPMHRAHLVGVVREVSSRARIIE